MFNYLYGDILSPIENIKLAGPDGACQLTYGEDVVISYVDDSIIEADDFKTYSVRLAAPARARVWGGTTTTFNVLAHRYVAFINDADVKADNPLSLYLCTESDYTTLVHTESIVPLLYISFHTIYKFQIKIPLGLDVVFYNNEVAKVHFPLNLTPPQGYWGPGLAHNRLVAHYDNQDTQVFDDRDLCYITAKGYFVIANDGTLWRVSGVAPNLVKTQQTIPTLLTYGPRTDYATPEMNSRSNGTFHSMATALYTAQTADTLNPQLATYCTVYQSYVNDLNVFLSAGIYTLVFNESSQLWEQFSTLYEFDPVTYPILQTSYLELFPSYYAPLHRGFDRAKKTWGIGLAGDDAYAFFDDTTHPNLGLGEMYFALETGGSVAGRSVPGSVKVRTIPDMDKYGGEELQKTVTTPTSEADSSQPLLLFYTGIINDITPELKLYYGSDNELTDIAVLGHGAILRFADLSQVTLPAVSTLPCQGVLTPDDGGNHTIYVSKTGVVSLDTPTTANDFPLVYALELQTQGDNMHDWGAPFGDRAISGSAAPEVRIYQSDALTSLGKGVGSGGVTVTMPYVMPPSGLNPGWDWRTVIPGWPDTSAFGYVFEQKAARAESGPDYRSDGIPYWRSSGGMEDYDLFYPFRDYDAGPPFGTDELPYATVFSRDWLGYGLRLPHWLNPAPLPGPNSAIPQVFDSGSWASEGVGTNDFSVPYASVNGQLKTDLIAPFSVDGTFLVNYSVPIVESIYVAYTVDRDTDGYPDYSTDPNILAYLDFVKHHDVTVNSASSFPPASVPYFFMDTSVWKPLQDTGDQGTNYYNNMLLPYRRSFTVTKVRDTISSSISGGAIVTHLARGAFDPTAYSPDAPATHQHIPPSPDEGLSHSSDTSTTNTETVTVHYVDGNTDVPTSHNFLGATTVTISGTGQVEGGDYFDAFYDYLDGTGTPQPTPFHPTGSNTGCLTLNGFPIEHYVSLPPFAASHVYTLSLSWGTLPSTPHDMHFAIDTPPSGFSAGSLSVLVDNPLPGVTALAHAYSGKVQVTVSGTVLVAGVGQADALWIYTDAGGSPVTPYKRTDVHFGVYDSGGIEWPVVSGSYADPPGTYSDGSYNAGHTYTRKQTADGGSAHVKFTSPDPSHNTGAFSVSITALGGFNGANMADQMAVIVPDPIYVTDFWAVNTIVANDLPYWASFYAQAWLRPTAPFFNYEPGFLIRLVSGVDSNIYNYLYPLYLFPNDTPVGDLAGLRAASPYGTGAATIPPSLVADAIAHIYVRDTLPPARAGYSLAAKISRLAYVPTVPDVVLLGPGHSGHFLQGHGLGNGTVTWDTYAGVTLSGAQSNQVNTDLGLASTTYGNAQPSFLPLRFLEGPDSTFAPSAVWLGAAPELLGVTDPDFLHTPSPTAAAFFNSGHPWKAACTVYYYNDSGDWSTYWQPVTAAYVALQAPTLSTARYGAQIPVLFAIDDNGDLYATQANFNGVYGVIASGVVNSDDTFVYMRPMYNATNGGKPAYDLIVTICVVHGTPTNGFLNVSVVNVSGIGPSGNLATNPFLGTTSLTWSVQVRRLPKVALPTGSPVEATDYACATILFKTINYSTFD